MSEHFLCVVTLVKSRGPFSIDANTRKAAQRKSPRSVHGVPSNSRGLFREPLLRTSWPSETRNPRSVKLKENKQSGKELALYILSLHVKVAVTKYTLM